VLHHHHQHHVAASDPAALLFHNNNNNHNESVAISFESHAIYSMQHDRNHLNRHGAAIAPPPPMVRMIPVARSLAEMYLLSSSSSSSSSSTTINHNIASSFCVPWNVVSDEWWTHHVEWTVFFEDDTHYCFERVRDAEKRAFLSSLYRLQFPLTTTKSKKAAQPGQQQEPLEPNDANPLCSNVLMKDMWSSGFSADMANVVDGLMRGRATQRPFQVTSREPWHYAVPKQQQQQQQQQQRRSSANATSAVAACPAQDMFCYFLPISSCPQQVPPTNEKNENATVVVQNDIYYPHLAFGNNDDETSSSKTARMRRNWYFEYATRLQTWMRKSVYDYTQHQIRTALPLQTPCTVMHVRRGDVVLHGASARRYHAIRDYINTTARRRYQMECNILLLTDDDNAIHEALTEFPNDMLHHWMYLNRTRYKAASGGFEQHVPSRNATLEMTILLSTLRLVRHCNSLIKSSSGFGTLILHEMRASNDSIWFVNVEDGYNYSNNNNNDTGTAVSNHHNKNIHSVIFNAKNVQTVGVSKPYIIRAPPPAAAATAAK
jgi:hypothetical protein